MPETDTIIEALECYRLKCHGEIRCENKECPYNCKSYEGHDIPYCAYNKLLFNAVQKLRAQEEQIEKLHRGIEQLRDALAEECKRGAERR